MQVLGHQLVTALDQVSRSTTGHGLEPTAIGAAINEAKAARVTIV
jgi:hypothetical protein